MLLTVVSSVIRARRVAAWAPIDVVSSRDPLQELPIRRATRDGTVRPAQTYDAVLDLKSIDELVVGVDLDRIAKSASGHEAVIRTQDGVERFREAIPSDYFSEGRFMLRLFARRFPPGDYFLEIEVPDATGEARVVAASWFQVVR
jgi:hypothetical protein